MENKIIRLECLKLAVSAGIKGADITRAAEDFYHFVTAQPKEEEPEDDSLLDAAAEEILNNLKAVFSETKVKVFSTGAK